MSLVVKRWQRPKRARRRCWGMPSECLLSYINTLPMTPSTILFVDKIDAQVRGRTGRSGPLDPCATSDMDE
jgi:hypothetical protein